jgi:outer membrane protein assembly factor BamB
VDFERRSAREGHPSRRVPDSIGVRVARGRVFFQWERGRDRRRREVLYGARDAFNGLPLWNVPTEYRCGAKRWQFVAGDGRLFAFLRRDAPLTALDAGTGRLLRTYDRGCRLPADARQWDGVEIRHCAGKLIQVAGAELFVLDASSGRRLWHRREKQGDLHFPVASAEANRLFVAVAEKRPHWSRWPHTVLTAVLCLELATGKVLWRNTEVAGGDIGQLIYDRGSLAVFGSGAIGGGDKPYIGNIRVRDGKLLFHRTFRKAYNRFGYNMLVRDGVMYYCDHLRIYAVDMASGEETRVFDDRGYNQRCNRFSATGDYFIYGLVTYVDRSFTGYVQSITRSGCAIGAVPANGLIYFTPNGCGCIPGQLRGHMALSPEPLRKPLPDAERLTTFRPRPKRRAGEPAPAAAAPPAGPVPADWVAPGAGEALETKPVAAGERKLVAVVHAHRLECRDDAGKVLWSFTAGGRVSSPPVLHDGLVLLGCHDGFVYCLQADDGSPVWRFLAAPYERRIIACGQLESSWPVYGVTMHNGLVCFSAGLHPELGGGIYAYGLEPTTGRLVWRKVLHKRTIVFDPKRPVRILPNRVLNDVLRSDGTQLHLPGLAFRPDEPDEQLRLKVEGDPSKADRRR